MTPPSSLLCPCSLCILSEDDPFIQFLSSPLLTCPPLLYLRASNVSLLETNARFSVFIYTDFPSPDIPDVHCNPSSSSSPSSYPNLLQPPKSISCNHDLPLIYPFLPGGRFLSPSQQVGLMMDRQTERDIGENV